MDTSLLVVTRVWVKLSPRCYQKNVPLSPGYQRDNVKIGKEFQDGIFWQRLFKDGFRRRSRGYGSGGRFNHDE